MDFAILGTGILAMVYGALLSRDGHQVVLLGRPESAQRIASAPCRLAGVFDITEQLRATTVEDWLAGNGRADLLLVCTKAIETERQLAPFREAARRSGTGRGGTGRDETRGGGTQPGGTGPGRIAAVASFQNGILKDRFLADVFGAERVVTAETMLSAAMRSDEAIMVVTKGAALLAGPADPAPFVDAFNAAGLPAEVAADPAALVWSKAAIVGAGFGTACLSRQPMQHLFTDPRLAGLFLDIVAEIAQLATAQGSGLADFAGLPARTYVTQSREQNLRLLHKMGAALAGAPAPLRVSMLQDLLAGKPMEVEEVLGGLVAEAEKWGVAAPELTLCYRVISALEAIRANGGLCRAGADPTS